jgi:hypothetical protein
MKLPKNVLNPLRYFSRAYHVKRRIADEMRSIEDFGSGYSERALTGLMRLGDPDDFVGSLFSQASLKASGYGRTFMNFFPSYATLKNDVVNRNYAAGALMPKSGAF